VVRIVTYDLEEFVRETDPSYPVRYEVRLRVAKDGVTELYLLRLSGVTRSGAVIEYREKRVFTPFQNDEKKAWFEYVNKLIEKLDAKPGRYLPR